MGLDFGVRFFNIFHHPQLAGPNANISSTSSFGRILAPVSTSPDSPAPRKPISVTPEQLNMAAVLPAPPAGNSPRGRAELAEVHHIQATRTEAMIADAKADDAEEDMFVFKDVLGEKFTAANLPATGLLSTHMHNDEGIIVNPAKTFFAKARPSNFDPTVKPVCNTNAN